MVQSPAEKTRPPCPPLGQPLSCTPGLLEPHSYPVSCRVEEVNWAAWEQTLPTVCEEPSGRGGPGEWLWGVCQCLPGPQHRESGLQAPSVEGLCPIKWRLPQSVPHLLTITCYQYAFYLMGVKWHLIAVLIYVSLVACDVEYSRSHF